MELPAKTCGFCHFLGNTTSSPMIELHVFVQVHYGTAFALTLNSSARVCFLVKLFYRQITSQFYL